MTRAEPPSPGHVSQSPPVGGSATPPAAGLSRAVRETRRNLSEAPDSQVLQVVKMIDGLEDRGAADEILAPVRNRLRTLVAHRPLRFTRLLFMPVDWLIVDTSKWRSNGSLVPRSALPHLAALVRDAADPIIVFMLDALIEKLEGRAAATGIVQPLRTRLEAPGEHEAVSLLWSTAAGILSHAARGPTPASWIKAGLPPAEFAPLASGIAPLLLAETQMRHWDDGMWDGLHDPDLIGLLHASAALGARQWGMMLTVFLLRFPGSPVPFLGAGATGGSGGAFPAAERAAMAAALAHVEQTQVVALGENSASNISSLAALIDGLIKQRPDVDCRQRALQQRARLRSDCLRTFNTALSDGLTQPLRDLDELATDEVVDHAELTARRLRQFEGAARALGAGGKYDALLSATSADLSALPCLETSDRARLIELLEGSATAWRSL